MRRSGEERGAAMITVVLVAAIGALAAATALSSATSAMGQSVKRRAWEQSLHLAEAGAARALGRIAADPSYNTGVALPTNPDRVWAIGVASTAPSERAREGEFAWIVAPGSSVVFGVGFVPSRAAPHATRVVRVDYNFAHPSGPRALLTQSSLSLAGTAHITGLGGSVHSNGDLTITGTVDVEHDATAAGTYRQSGSPTIGGTSGGGHPAIALPAVSPAAYRSLTGYDLCPDATVRATAPLPCAGLVQGTGLGPGWNGWRFSGTTWRVNGGTAGDAGVYVYHCDVSITGSPGSAVAPWRATIVVEGLRVGSMLTSGDIIISGNPVLHAWTKGVALVAERDLRLAGGPSQEIQGMVVAGEQIDLPGSGTIIGSVVGAGTTDSVGSPVSSNSATGGFTIRAEFGAPSVQGGISPVRWGEV